MLQKLSWLASICLGLTVAGFCQGTKDVDAITAINASIAASGGLTNVSAVQDFSAQGNITFYWAEQNVQGTATVKGLGTSDFRIDSVLQAGTRSWSVTGGTGVLLDTDGSRTTVPFYNAINVGILSWRIPNLLAALANSVANVTYIGQVQSDVGIAIQIHYVVPDSSNPDPDLMNLNSADYFFDPTTYLLIETRDTMYPPTSVNNGQQHEILFSNYQNVSGVVVPFTITETINGAQTWSLQLTSIAFNVGLTAQDFQL